MHRGIRSFTAGSLALVEMTQDNCNGVNILTIRQSELQSKYKKSTCGFITKERGVEAGEEKITKQRHQR